MPWQQHDVPCQEIRKKDSVKYICNLNLTHQDVQRNQFVILMFVVNIVTL